MSVDILPQPTKALVDEALALVGGHVAGLYPFEPFYLRGSFNILYQAAKQQPQPQLFTSHVQNEALALCDYFIRCQLDLFYAYVFKAYIQLNHKKQYKSALDTLYLASQQFIPRSTLSYDFVTDYMTIFNYCIKYYQQTIIDLKFPLLTMTDLDGTAPKFAFDITHSRQDAYMIPLEDDEESNTALHGSTSPAGNNNNIHGTPAPGGRTPAITKGYQPPNHTAHATPQAKHPNLQPMSAKLSQSATKTKSGSSEHKPMNSSKNDHFPAFALPEADDEDYDLDDDGAFGSNEQFYSTQQQQQQPQQRSLSGHYSSSRNDPMNTSSMTLQHQEGFYSAGGEDLDQMRRELEELERSRASLNKNSFLYQISAAVGAVGLASLWVIGKNRPGDEGMTAKDGNAIVAASNNNNGEAGTSTQQQKEKKVRARSTTLEAAAETAPKQRPPRPKKEQVVKTGTLYTYTDDNGKEQTMMRPRRHYPKGTKRTMKDEKTN